MSIHLDRLGRSAFARRGLVLAAWIVLLLAFGISGLTLGQPTANSFSVPGTESQRAIEVLAERFPALGADGASARVVVAAPAGETITSDSSRTAVRAMVAELGSAPQVAMALDPYFFAATDESETLAYIQVTYDVPMTHVSDEAREALLAVAEQGRAAGLTVEVGGDALMALPVVGGEEVVGVAVAAVVLVVTLGSLVAAGLPLVMALFSVGIGLSAIALATNLAELTTFTSTLALMLGLAVAIDYSLFIVSRYRHELAVGREPSDAIGRSIATAGSTVLFAGSTVVVALLALGVVGIPLLTQMGIAAAFTVVVSVVVALTLLPALLGYLGDRLRPAHDPEGDASASGWSARWARFTTRWALPVVAVSTVTLLVLAAPALDLRLGLPDDSSAAPSSTQRKAYDLISKSFGPGINGPLVVVLEAASVDDPAASLEQAIDAVEALPQVAAVTASMFDAAGEAALFQVTPTGGPSSESTEDLVTAIRAIGADLQAATGATLAVTGRTALNIDTSARMRDALVPYLVIVVGLALVLLTLVFRSVLVPVKAALGFALSMLATLGVVVAVFQWGWFAELIGVAQPGPVLSLLPILIVGVVFGLAMDYEVFLVTRMREAHVEGAGPRQAVVSGFSHNARVVTAAAIIMISVFAGFVLSSDPLVKTLGFALAVAVLLDAFVVRMTFVPAAMAALGRYAWWLPRWLDRLLPDVDVEGRASGARSAEPADLA